MSDWFCGGGSKSGESEYAMEITMHFQEDIVVSEFGRIHCVTWELLGEMAK
jgi:hypothetical protein